MLALLFDDERLLACKRGITTVLVDRCIKLQVLIVKKIRYISKMTLSVSVGYFSIVSMFPLELESMQIPERRN